MFEEYMADSWIRTRHFWIPNRGESPHTCIIQDTNDFADSVRVMGNLRKSKKLQLLNRIFSSRNFLFDGN